MKVLYVQSLPYFIKLDSQPCSHWPIIPSILLVVIIGGSFTLYTDYDSMYQQSVTDPEKFWSVQAKRFLEWDKQFTKVNDCKKEEGIVRWFNGGKLNVSSEHISAISTLLFVLQFLQSLTENCLDRHVAKYPDRTAIIWEKNDQAHEKTNYRLLNLYA